MGGDFVGEINFFSHTTDGSRPCLGGSNSLKDSIVNWTPSVTRLTIHDLRGKENNFDVDRNGFEVHKYDGSINGGYDENTEAQRIDYDEMSSFVKKRTGASRVIAFNNAFRYRGPRHADVQYDPKYRNHSIVPHVDYDSHSALLKLKEVFGEEEANKIMQKRFQFFTIWRPVGPNPIQHRPLLVCDYSSVDVLNDAHSMEICRDPHSNSGLTISYNTQDAQKWYYLSDMKSDEMVLMKMFDSMPDVAQYCFHTSCTNENVPPPNVQQISHDVRCIAIYD